ncbi:hypothetical protein DITRI_Ditri13aG0042300 [Diplodiscus trichospermus]
MMPMNSVSPSLSSQVDHNVPLSTQNLSVTSPAGVDARTPQRKPSVGQMKTLEALGASPPLPSKKRKVSRALSEQSIRQLNDVTAVSGVNIQEEVELLFSGHKADTGVSEASRRVVHEQEERGILLKTPLQKKLAEIMTKCGLKNISNDVERCFFLCVEERMRGLIHHLIRLSKQIEPLGQGRIGEKPVEVEVQKLDKPEGSGVDGDKEKGSGQVKSVKTKEEEDDKMEATAANVAICAAIGEDDLLSKWKLMVEEACQKHERSLPSPLPSGATRKFGRNQVVVPKTRVARTISIKDVNAVLEQEPQMSRSTLIYRLYERTQTMAAAQ